MIQFYGEKRYVLLISKMIHPNIIFLGKTLQVMRHCWKD